MSSEVVTPSLVLSSDRVIGRVKWFNNKTGYGFVSLVSGDAAVSDIFVHHSNIVVSVEQYRYLVEGEYVEFSLVHTPGKEHEYQAGDVSGIKGGKLLCETRRESRQNRVEYSVEHQKQPQQKSASSSVPTPAPVSRKAPKKQEEGEWVLATKQDKKPRGRPSGKSANL